MATSVTYLTQCNQVLVIVHPGQELLPVRGHVILFVMNDQMFRRPADGTTPAVTFQDAGLLNQPAFVKEVFLVRTLLYTVIHWSITVNNPVGDKLSFRLTVQR